MGGDYPDYTSLMQIIGSDIMVPIDVQGAYIQMPVDIQGAYIMMPVDIQAQYATLDINIKAATVDKIAIDIKTATIGNLSIDLKAQSVGFYSQPEWAAKAGEDIDKYSYDPDLDEIATVMCSYEVPGNRTCYITGFGGYVLSYQACLGLSLRDQDAATPQKAVAGGIGGCNVQLRKPIKIPSGHTVVIYAYCYAVEEMAGRVSMHGFLVPT